MEDECRQSPQDLKALTDFLGLSVPYQSRQVFQKGQFIKDFLYALNRLVVWDTGIWMMNSVF
jgi:hypothetical protein